ncbi:hypothetical protein EAG_10614, partial [Camponotus floridanus]
KSKIKTMLIALFDVEDMISNEFVPRGTTIEFYKTMEKLFARINRVRLEMKRNDDWFLLHYSAPVHN